MPISALSAATTACETANWRLSNLELQKLLYLSQRTYIGRKHGRPLLDEEFEAWDYGPVVPEIYQIAKIYGASRIEALPPVRRIPTRSEHRVIREVVEHFADRTPGQLVELTHRPGGAWDRNFTPGRRHIRIPNRDILDEYERLFGRAA